MVPVAFGTIAFFVPTVLEDRRLQQEGFGVSGPGPPVNPYTAHSDNRYVDYLAAWM
jgi:hypothetical protein